MYIRVIGEIQQGVRVRIDENLRWHNKRGSDAMLRSSVEMLCMYFSAKRTETSDREIQNQVETTTPK